MEKNRAPKKNKGRLSFHLNIGNSNGEGRIAVHGEDMQFSLTALPGKAVSVDVQRGVKFDTSSKTETCRLGFFTCWMVSTAMGTSAPFWWKGKDRIRKPF
jgi:hypothetical protein